MLKVSVIIPLFNNREGLNRTLTSLYNQSLSKDQFEVIVIDNGSDDQPEDVIEQFQAIINLKYLEEHTYLNSPYSSRNRGIEESEGDVIVLLDSTCSPKKDWLENGLVEIHNGADLVGGNVTFDIKKNSTLGEMYDSLTNIRMKDTIERKSAAKTTNLFIRKKVFDTIGMFPEGLRSGGDVRWTYKATSAGFKLVFSKEAEVIMKPRGFKKLMKKQFRVGKGHPAIWKESNTFRTNFIKKIVLFWVPPNPMTIKKWIKNSEKPFLNRYFIQLYFTGWFLRLINALGCIAGFRKVKS